METEDLDSSPGHAVCFQATHTIFLSPLLICKIKVISPALPTAQDCCAVRRKHLLNIVHTKGQGLWKAFWNSGLWWEIQAKKGGILKGHEEAFGGKIYTHYLGSGDGFMGYTRVKTSKLYILNIICQLYLSKSVRNNNLSYDKTLGTFTFTGDFSNILKNKRKKEKNKETGLTQTL